MAIRPADLQLAYLAAPQNAAQVNSAQQAAANAQQSAQASFAAQVQKREETIKETDHAERTAIRTNPDGQGNAGGYTPQGRRHRARPGQPDAAPEEAPGMAADGEHFIDFTA
jgi:hypothetical protein